MTPTPAPILVVEDDPDLRDALADALARRGYEVIAAGDGVRAVGLAAASPPALALVDLLIPGQSGFRVTEELKARFGDRVRVLVMSGHASAAHRDYAVASGADGFLAKPFGEAALAAAVEALLPAPMRARVPRPRVRIGA